MNPSEFARRAAPWLKVFGPSGDVVLSSRVRLARNVEGHPFPARLPAPLRRELEARLAAWISETRAVEDPHYWNLEQLPAVDRMVLLERHLISRELAQGSGERGVTVSGTEQTSVMTNEEDHIRIQVMRPGLDLEAALASAQEVDRRLESRVPYAFDEDFGFLTACPTNVGTGLRVSAMLHLPGLVLGEQIEKVFQSASRVGLTVRGFHGEGTKAAGDVLQISNQHTLGRTEEEILGAVRTMAEKIVEYERGVRTHLVEKSRTRVEDKVMRSLGLLRYARRVSSDESLNLLSAVRFGISTKLFGDLKLGDLNELLVLTQPGHLQALRGQEIRSEDRDVLRAQLLRERFKPEAN
jgi:protein arginine kinase